jgi:hypothetical protein
VRVPLAQGLWVRVPLARAPPAQGLWVRVPLARAPPAQAAGLSATLQIDQTKIRKLKRTITTTPTTTTATAPMVFNISTPPVGSLITRLHSVPQYPLKNASRFPRFYSTLVDVE